MNHIKAINKYEMCEYEDYCPLPDGVSLEGKWLMVDGEVNVADLCSRPGGVIRIKQADSLRYIPPSSDDYARLAGMISDAA
jgi:hypothetical protein